MEDGRKTPEDTLQEVEVRVGQQEERIQQLQNVGDMVLSQEERIQKLTAQHLELNERVLHLQFQNQSTANFQKAAQKPFKYEGERDAVTIENWIYAVKRYVRTFRIVCEDAVVLAGSYLARWLYSSGGHAKQSSRSKKETQTIQFRTWTRSVR
jgi:uncharacterized coiled-coil protein SlyX